MRSRDKGSPVAIFRTKALTLQWLAEHSHFTIPPLELVEARDWRQNPRAVLDRIRKEFQGVDLAIRSSCSQEDTSSCSAAGAFTSVLHVAADDEAGVSDAINAVFASYKADESALASEHCFVQPMVEDIVMSGVIFTRNSDNGSPYCIINYDDESGRTDTITSGTGVSKTVSVYRGAQERDFDSPRVFKLFKFSQEVEKVCENDALDIEFCVDANDVIHLVQVRPICANGNWEASVDTVVHENLGHVASFLHARFVQTSRLHGHRTILGVMPDWNPAEMIGVSPHPLAWSLYRELITRRVWSKAREVMGYRVMPPEELMVLVAGRPYIDVRLSFNSFLPRDLDESIAARLVSAWLDRLDAKPELHDKIEFDIAQTAMDFCFDSHMDTRYPGVLSSEQRAVFRAVLAAFTQDCLYPSGRGAMAYAENLVQILAARQETRPFPKQHYLSHIADYVEECQELGTLPFSILARHGFIAESLLRTAVMRGALSVERVNALKSSIDTIAGELSRDFVRVTQGEADPTAFLARYGHLRPGSYDILSPQYEDRAELFSAGAAVPQPPREQPHFAFDAKEKSDLTKLLAEAGLTRTTPDLLLQYCRRAIKGREYAKFVFTRNVSHILEMLAKWGAKYDFSREDLAYLHINDVLAWNAVSLLRTGKQYFREQVERGKELFSVGRGLQLGYLIRSPRDVMVVPQHRSAPNFIGQGSASAPIVVLDARASCDIPIAGTIVCIENADPGFDWIFTRHIAGLVTKFGGANSHMAIRCAEYGLPAAIGVGEKLFEEFIRMDRGILNAGHRLLQQG